VPPGTSCPAANRRQTPDPAVVLRSASWAGITDRLRRAPAEMADSGSCRGCRGCRGCSKRCSSDKPGRSSSRRMRTVNWRFWKSRRRTRCNWRSLPGLTRTSITGLLRIIRSAPALHTRHIVPIVLVSISPPHSRPWLSTRTARLQGAWPHLNRTGGGDSCTIMRFNYRGPSPGRMKNRCTPRRFLYAWDRTGFRRGTYWYEEASRTVFGVGTTPVRGRNRGREVNCAGWTPLAYARGSDRRPGCIQHFCVTGR